MEFKDLAGLSKPLTRLIEVVSEGIGRLSEPYLIRKEADAKAYEIGVISEALKNVAEEHQLPVVYEDGQIEVWQKPEDHTLELGAGTLNERVSHRLDYQERKRQINIEKITAGAAQELLSESEVPEEKPDEDWISRFFNVAQDVSSEQMQDIWGRILAGEIKRPGSYSLRTLDFVRNLTKRDAELIEHVGQYAFEKGNAFFVPILDKSWLRDNRKIFPINQFVLAELGLLYPTDLRITFFSEPSEEPELLIHGDLIIVANRTHEGGNVSMKVWKFSELGREILQLIPRALDDELVGLVGKFFQAKNADVTIGKITERLPNGVRYEITQELVKEQNQT